MKKPYPSSEPGLIPENDDGDGDAHHQQQGGGGEDLWRLAARDPAQQRAHQQFGDDTGAPPGEQRAHLALRAGDKALVEVYLFQVVAAADELGLQVILAVEGNKRQMAEAVRRESVWAEFVDRALAGHGHIVHGAKRNDSAAAQGQFECRYAAEHLPFAQPVLGEVLVVGNDFQRQPLLHQRVERR